MTQINNITPGKSNIQRRIAYVLAMSFGLIAVVCQAAPALQESQNMTSTSIASELLSVRQQAILPIAAFAAVGDLPRLNTALNQGLDTGLSVSDAREVLVQLYAYAGFPRSLNALGS